MGRKWPKQEESSSSEDEAASPERTKSKKSKKHKKDKEVKEKLNETQSKIHHKKEIKRKASSSES